MILNFGSINIDNVYWVSELPASGETCIAQSHAKFLGGKGINQSIAISKAKGELVHVGAVGPDGQWAINQIESLGVKTDHISILDHPTGHAMICVDDHGENQIVVASGTNRMLAKSEIDKVLESADPKRDWVLLQNETNLADHIVSQSKSIGFQVAYAAAPFVAEVTLALIDQIDLLAVNEGEAQALAQVLCVEPSSLPSPKLLITKGSSGAEFHAGGKMIWQNAFQVEAVDSTGAGDTFLGSFLARFSQGETSQEALRYAAAASAIQVTRPGAAVAIPEYDEVHGFLKAQEQR